MFTWTDEPYRALWDHLLFLKHEANVRNLLSGSMKSGRNFCIRDPSLLDSKARQISKSVTQAHEYYIAADAVTLATSPLLYFYGMLSLAKAVVVANDLDKSLDSIKYHGLHTRPRSDELRRYAREPDKYSLEEEFAVVDDGVFPALTVSTMHTRLPKDAEIRLHDVFRIDPELNGLIAKLYGDVPGSASSGSRDRKGDTVSISISRTAPDDLRRGFPGIDAFFDVGQGKHEGAARLISKAGVPFTDRFGYYQVLSGGYFLVDGLRFMSDGVDFRKYLRPEICDYIGMFILSTCVRYKQEFWSELLEGRKSGSAALVQRFVHVSRRRYPNFILDSMFGEHFDYGIAGRMI
jgi:hypothetical protein